MRQTNKTILIMRFQRNWSWKEFRFSNSAVVHNPHAWLLTKARNYDKYIVKYIVCSAIYKLKDLNFLSTCGGWETSKDKTFLYLWM